MNIYAYKHIRTHQVVYSLTKSMDNTKILKQLFYHGKKTVPAALRRDVWRPYFSVHFSKTPAGAMKGLKVFQELRELSALRQLKPPKEITIATQKDFDDVKKQYDPVEWTDKTTNVIPKTTLLEPPVVGERLPRKLLAKKLMNQAATSVADIAAILTRHTNPEQWKLEQKKNRGREIEAKGPTPQQRMYEMAEKRQAREEVLSIRAHNRLQEIRKREDAKADQIRQRQGYLIPRPGAVKTDLHTSDRISIEYDGIGQNLAMIEEADQGTREELGADESLRQALADIENEKRTQRQSIEKSMGAQIEQRLMEMTQTERDQIEKDVEAERAQKQAEIDSQVAATRENYKQQRAELYQQPASAERTKALRKLSRDSQAEVYTMKTDLRTRHLKWVGPFAAIAAEVDKAMSEIDERWRDTLAELNQDASSERGKSANHGNHEVQIRWANIRDATHVNEKSWPGTVFHVELQPKAVSKKQNRAVTTQFLYDIDEEPVEKQYGQAEAQRRNTVHVFGSEEPDATSDIRSKGRYESPVEASAQSRDARNMRIQEWTDTEAILLRDRIVTMRTESDELRRHFARTEIDRSATPTIALSMDSIDDALAAFDDFELGSYDPSMMDAVDAHIDYIRAVHSSCLEEIANSADPIAEEARVKYMLLNADRIALESRNAAARHQANIRQTFFALFNERERLEDAIERFKDNEQRYTLAKKELQHFDYNYDFIKNIFVRRETALADLPLEIEDSKAEVSRLQKELDVAGASATEEDNKQDTIDTLRAQLKDEQDLLRKNTAELTKLQEEEAGGRDAVREAIRHDKEAWLQYKRIQILDTPIDTPESPVGEKGEGKEGTDGVDSEGNVQDDRGMVMEPPEDKRGRMSRMVEFFKWKGWTKR